MAKGKSKTVPSVMAKKMAKHSVPKKPGAFPAPVPGKTSGKKTTKK